MLRYYRFLVYSLLNQFQSLMNSLLEAHPAQKPGGVPHPYRTFLFLQRLDWQLGEDSGYSLLFQYEKETFEVYHVYLFRLHVSAILM